MSIKYLNVVLVAACVGIVYTLTHLAHEGARLERQVEQLTRDLIPAPPYHDPRGATVVITSYYTADGHLAGRRVDRPRETYRQTLADVLAGPQAITGSGVGLQGGAPGHYGASITTPACGCTCAACQAGHK